MPREEGGILRLTLASPAEHDPPTRWLWPSLWALACLALGSWMLVRALEPAERSRDVVVAGVALIVAGYLTRKAITQLPTVRVDVELDGLALTVVQHHWLGRRVVRCRLDRLQGLLLPPSTSTPPRSNLQPRRKKRRKTDAPRPSPPPPTGRLLAIDEDGRVLTLAAGYPRSELQQIADLLRGRCPSLAINPTLAGQPWPVAECLHVRQQDGQIAVLQTPAYGLGITAGVVVVVAVTAILAMNLVRGTVQLLGQIPTDAWRGLPALLAALLAAGVLRIGWAIVLVLLAHWRLTVGPDGLSLERLGLFGLGRSRRHWPLDRVAAFGVRPRHNKQGVVGHDLAFRPAHTDVWIALINGALDDADSLGRIKSALDRLVGRRPAGRPTDLAAVPWPGRITCRREADGAVTLGCPAPGLTARGLFPLLIGSALAVVAVVVASARYQDRGAAFDVAWLIPLLLLTLGLTLLGWTLVRTTCHTQMRADPAGLEVQTRSWLGTRQWRWKREQIRSIHFTGSGVRWPGRWQSLFTSPIDSLAVTVNSPTGGERTHHLLGLYWPQELGWCASVLAQASGRPP